MGQGLELRALHLSEEVAGVTVFAADLAVNAQHYADFWTTLNEAEQTRAARFHFERDRRCYVAARGWLRALLGKRLGLDPADVCFEVGPHGKPTLVAKENRLEFNVSHSGERGLFAFGEHGQPVGVDLESDARLGGTRDLPALAARTLCPADLARWQAQPEPQRRPTFLRAWTRLEAYAKAQGDGLANVLGGVSVLTGSGGEVSWPGAPGWRGWDLPVDEGWAAALVIGCPRDDDDLARTRRPSGSSGGNE